MISAEHAISKLRRDLTVGAFIKGVMISVMIGALIVGPLVGARTDVLLVMAVLGITWMAWGFRSFRETTRTAQFPSLIATGQFDVAEDQIERMLRAFSPFKNVKLLGVHHLAMLRHAQRRWQDTAMLCRALLRQRLGSLSGLNKTSRLILADALLEMNDVAGAYEAITRLYDQHLTLGEAMNLLSIQLDYESRIGAWDAMMRHLPAKVQLAEVMIPPSSARTQALLALAAKKTGRMDWSDWLRKRVELIADPKQLCAQRPLLWEVWQRSQEPEAPS
jgi:hypothetical protein